MKRSILSSAVSRQNQQPLYKQLAHEIETQVRSDAWRVGTQIPSERELCLKYGLSRITVRNAISLAERDGVVERVQGVGTFVSREKLEQPLSELKSFALTLSQTGIQASTTVVASGQISADLQKSLLFGIPMSDTIHQLDLVGSGDGQPMVHYASLIPGVTGQRAIKVAGELESEGKGFSSLDILQNSLGVKLSRIQQTFEAVVAEESLAGILKVSLGHPIFRVESVVQSDAVVIEHRIAHYRGDKYKFAIDRTL